MFRRTGRRSRGPDPLYLCDDNGALFRGPFSCTQAAPMSSSEAQWTALLAYINEQRGVDLRDYKSTTLGRRFEKRLQATGCEDHGQYLDRLQASPDEFDALLDSLFINVTSFFRDPEAWEALRANLSELLDPSSDRPLRVWCAGIASGEEAYTVAMVLADMLGMKALRERVKIYATDVDEGALVQARQGSYTAAQVEEVPEALRERYMEPDGERFTFVPELRRTVIFGRHDLLKDAPISKLDLLVCRNTLMYFNRSAQDRILARFHFALGPGALLLLGTAEMMLSRRHLFQPVENGVRLFRKTDELSLRDRLSLMKDGDPDGVQEADVAEQVELRDLAYQASPIPQILVDRAGTLALANEAAREQLGISTADIGRPFQDVEISYRPVELRSHIERVFGEGDAVRLEGVARLFPDGRSSFLNIEVQPLRDTQEGKTAIAASICFTDVTRVHELNAQLEQSRDELETAYEELQSTNEELETTNEELQSTIEELETTNEELQSTNEELETMNEELQSTNEEMSAINEELQERNEVNNRLNAYMRSVLNSVGAAIVVLDEASRVQMWNSQAEDLWGLRPDEVQDAPFLRLDIGLPVEQLAEQVRATLRGTGDGRERVLDAHDRRGRSIRCRVSTSPLSGPDDSVSGTILLMEPLLSDGDGA